MQNNISSSIEWKPQQLLNGDMSVILMILNQPLISVTEKFLRKHWSSAVLRISVDGGTQYLRKMSNGPEDLVPEIICGDFDSVSAETLNYYQNLGAQIIPAPDQNETDFTKALRISVSHIAENKKNVDAILVIARNGDRLDHVLGNLNTLYSALEICPFPVFILGDNSLTWLLKEGKHRIHLDESMMNSHVGLIPLGEPCLDVTTTGLKWNLSHGKMQFGGLISVCNRFDGSEEVTVETDKKLVWTMEVFLK